LPSKTLPYMVSVRDSTTVLSLSSVLSTLSATSLSNHLAVLRRDINAYYIDCLLTQPTSLSQSSSKDSSGISSQTLSFHPSPFAEESLSTRLKNLASVLEFLDAHIFATLPPSDAASFKRTLCKPVTMALLQQFLIAHLPSTLAALPPYLHLVMQANEFEEKYIVGMLGQDPRDREIQTWTNAVSLHYERKRRAQILEDARQMILRQDNGVQIRVEVELPNAPPASLPNSAPAAQSSGSGSEGAADVSDDAWGLEGEESGDTDDVVSAAEEEDAWGFDDAPTEPETTKPENLPEPALPRDTSAEAAPAADDSAWGWNDSGGEVNHPATTSPQASSSDNGADWDDDPWGESSSPSPPSSGPTPPPKPASRLEKLASKAKAKATPPYTPPPVTDPRFAVAGRTPPATTRPSEPVGIHNTTPSTTKKEPPKSVPQAIETYAISGRARQLADAVDGVLHEGKVFASTSIFDSKASAAQQQTRGLVILQTAPAVLDLFRALYPVKFSQRPTEPKSIVFANDCIYARGRALSAARHCATGAKDRLLETADSLEAIGMGWYEQCVVGVLILLFVVLR
jgi:centromere/kinetochore protein ZW10